MMAKAQKRVYLATLYIGPGADPQHQREHEFLTALASIPPEVDVKVLMDQNRGLRPVPTKAKEGTERNTKSRSKTTSSAQAVFDALKSNNDSSNHELFLLQALSSPVMRAILPNPLDEVAAVFHIKAYVIDDEVLLSGANLSEEYFTDRQDRYLLITKTGNGLVDFYAKLIEALCSYAGPYEGDISSRRKPHLSNKGMSVEELAQRLNELFVDDQPKASEEILAQKDIVGVACPTFQAPPGYFDGTATSLEFQSDLESTLSLLDAASMDKDSHVQLSSAYLNPTQELVNSLKKHRNVDLLSAGHVSHGFRPKKKAGNKGKSWIPLVFDHLARDASKQLPHARLWHWEREGWTFHSKGLWLSSGPTLSAAVVGSGNYGHRSYERDWESNCIFVFPSQPTTGEEESTEKPRNALNDLMQQEWNRKLEAAKPFDGAIEPGPLPPHIRMLYNYIHGFF